VEDREIVLRIGQLAEEERELGSSHQGVGLTPDEQGRLHEIEVTLDQCWDLLRQRRARRAAGQDPDDVEVRPATVVEGYRQ